MKFKKIIVFLIFGIVFSSCDNNKNSSNDVNDPFGSTVHTTTTDTTISPQLLEFLQKGSNVSDNITLTLIKDYEQKKDEDSCVIEKIPEIKSQNDKITGKLNIQNSDQYKIVTFIETQVNYEGSISSELYGPKPTKDNSYINIIDKNFNINFVSHENDYKANKILIYFFDKNYTFTTEYKKNVEYAITNELKEEIFENAIFIIEIERN